MLRLRTTMVLSVLGLALGLGGTQWLSERSDASAVASTSAAAFAGTRTVQHRQHNRPLARRMLAVAAPPRIGRRLVASADLPQRPTVVAPEPELVPIATPSEHGMPYDKLRGHLDGRVVVHLAVDGRGDVIASAVVQSSGDSVLDAHALRSVRGWRFAVPADAPWGLSADLPMQFSSRDIPVSSTR